MSGNELFENSGTEFLRNSERLSTIIETEEPESLGSPSNSIEPSFLPLDLERLAFLPIENQELHKYYMEQRSTFWTPDEIDFSKDSDYWSTLGEDTKRYIIFILSLFAQLDGIVNENLVKHFKVQTGEMAKECSNFYTMQEAIELIHNETYSFLIYTFIRDPDERKKSLNSIKYYPAIRNIAEWSYSWMDSKKPLLERLVAFACLEGIIFSSAFAGIYWIKKQNILPGLTTANEWIARDEALHTRYAVSLYHHITSIWRKMEVLPTQRIKEIITSAVDITERFTRDAMNVHLVGINADDMVAYIKCTADVLAEALDGKKIYDTTNPFDWMVVIGVPNKTNFFERKVTEYARDTENFTFDLNVEF